MSFTVKIGNVDAYCLFVIGFSEDGPLENFE
jgi:hypothetical protein